MSHFPLTYATYIARRFVTALLVTLLVLGTVLALLDMVELLRKASSNEALGFVEVSYLTLLKAPTLIEQVMPLTVLFAGMFSIWRLNRNQELTIGRAAGVSIWQMLGMTFAAAALVGVLAATAFNPLSAVMQEEYNELDQVYFGRSGTVLRVDENGLWLREPNETGQTVIFAARASDNGLQLHDVTVMNIRPDAAFGGRLDARIARFDNGALMLTDVDITEADKKTRSVPTYRVPTNFTIERLLENFSPPETVPFWSLPSFISNLERSGFSALRHRLQFYSLLATPALFAGMMLLAASFSLRLPRRGGLGILALLGAVVGFGFFFATDVMRALAEAGTIPALLAASLPAGVGILAGVTLLLHLEDG